MTTGRINQVTIFGGGDDQAPERTGRPQAPLGRGRSSFGSDRVRSRVRPRGRVVGPGREPAASNVTPIHFPQLNSPGQGPPKDGSPPPGEGGSPTLACLPREEVTRDRSRASPHGYRRSGMPPNMSRIVLAIGQPSTDPHGANCAIRSAIGRLSWAAGRRVTPR